MAELEKASTPSSQDKASLKDNLADKGAVAFPDRANVDIGSIYGVNEKSLVRKLDRTLLPALTLLYLLSFLDRSNGTPSSSPVTPDFSCIADWSGSCQCAGGRSCQRLAHE